MEKTRNDEQRVEHGIRRIHAAYLLAASMNVDEDKLCDPNFYEKWLDNVHAKCDVDINAIDTVISKVWHTVLTMMRREVQERRNLRPYKPRVPDETGTDIIEQLKALKVLCFELLAGSNHEDLHINKAEIQVWEDRIATWLHLTTSEKEYAHRIVWQTYMDALCELGGISPKTSKSDVEAVRKSEPVPSKQDQQTGPANDEEHAQEPERNGHDTSGPGSRPRIAAAVARHTPLRSH